MPEWIPVLFESKVLPCRWTARWKACKSHQNNRHSSSRHSSSSRPSSTHRPKSTASLKARRTARRTCLCLLRIGQNELFRAACQRLPWPFRLGQIRRSPCLLGSGQIWLFRNKSGISFYKSNHTHTCHCTHIRAKWKLLHST